VLESPFFPSDILLKCPSCGGLDGAGATCSACGFAFEFRDGILKAMPPGRREAYSRFLGEYSIIRNAEGRGSDDPAYYLALPFRDLTGRHSEQWAIRGRTYRFFERHILPTLERGRRLYILDLGAGTGWLSYRLARRTNRPVAVDILDDRRDGLAAAGHYFTTLAEPFPLVEAEFDRLPFADGQFDLAAFNSSFHYSTDYAQTLTEALRCLRPGGMIVILDSPIYRSREHGEKMREERHHSFQAQYGFRSDSIPSLEFLYQAQLEELGRRLRLNWTVYRPWYGMKWHARPLKAILKRGRPPSRFWILVGSPCL
jgi:ubiquinone/menaquinone biosynthesis C-methylase UbiE